MDIPDPIHFDPTFAQPTPIEGDAEAALEALRAAIGQPVEDFSQPTPLPQPQPSTSNDVTRTQTLEKGLAALSQLSDTSQTILDNMNLPGVIQGLTGSLRLLVESNRRQADIVRGLVAQLSGNGERNSHRSQDLANKCLTQPISTLLS